MWNHVCATKFVGVLACTSAFAIPHNRRSDLTLEEAQADPAQLNGELTIAYWLNEDCSGSPEVSQVFSASGFDLYSLDPLSDNPEENLECLSNPGVEGCSLVDTFYTYMQPDGYQLFVKDSAREYPFLEYGSCNPTQVYGDGVYFAITEGDSTMPAPFEMIEDDDSDGTPMPVSAEDTSDDTDEPKPFEMIEDDDDDDSSDDMPETKPVPVAVVADTSSDDTESPKPFEMVEDGEDDDGSLPEPMSSDILELF